MSRAILFLDRDGTLIQEPPDEQVDSLDKVRLVPGVMPALAILRDRGYAFVLVSNQDGLGTESFPREQFETVQAFVREMFDSQGIRFEAERFCPHREGDGCVCRKPALGLLRDYVDRRDVDWGRSAVIGDRATDLELARRLNVRGLRVGPEGSSWEEIVRELTPDRRTARVDRKTNETAIAVEVDLDGGGDVSIETGLGFLDHMLEQLARHGGFSLRLRTRGDLHVDEHHTVEDTALALGEAMRRALGDKRGIGRYGFVLPMDEAQCRVAVDLGGRPFTRFRGEFHRERVGDLPTELVPHFVRSLAESLRAAIHVAVEGENEHHMIESVFKGIGRALRPALAREGTELPTTKGLL